MIVTTSITQNYLAKAQVLAESVKRHHPDAIFCLCLVERPEQVTVQPDSRFFDHVMYPNMLWGEATETLIFKYTVVEACTAVKGALMRHLVESFKGESKFIYMDPDTLVTSPMVELEKKLDDAEIVLTPHLVDPEVTMEAIWDNEISTMRHGIYNLGFLGIRRGPESNKFLKWWEHRLNHLCFADYANGLFTDQKWVDMAPAFFDVAILRHRGYNAAPWNIGQRHFSGKNLDEIKIGNEKLRFFHFSGFDSGANLAMIKKYAQKDSELLFALRDDYVERLKDAGQERYEKIEWTFSRFKNGNPIPVSARKAFRSGEWSRPFDEERVADKMTLKRQSKDLLFKAKYRAKAIAKRLIAKTI